MNVSAVSPMAQRSQDFDLLQSSLQAGNISGAQMAFASFLQDVQKTGQTAGSSGLFAPGSQAQRDLQALGGALKSANLTGAKQAFQNLKQDIQNAGEPGSAAPAVRPHHPFKFSQIAANGVDTVQPSSQAIGSILNSKA